MYIIVIGGGKIGYHLGKALLDEGHEILVIEKDADKVELICSELGSVCVRGDGCETTTLDEAGTSRADMLIAVTGDDEDNLVACQVAKHKFNVPRTIARISNPKNEAIFKKLGIDATVSSTNVILEYIEQEVPTHPLTHLLEIRDEPPESTLSLLIRKQEKPRIPTGNTVLQAEDQLIAVTPPESEQALRTALRGS
jgi:trk system potassium uptake protein TrkA